jgi:hypothetical protein
MTTTDQAARQSSTTGVSRRRERERVRKAIAEDRKVASENQRKVRSDAILFRARSHPYSKHRDDSRVPLANALGGLPLVDEKVLTTLRGIAKEYLKALFGRIMSGNFNLTTISFPIKCMKPVSLLETFGTGNCMGSLYLNKAAQITDPLERFKYVITSQIAPFHVTSNFLKPVLSWHFIAS